MIYESYQPQKGNNLHSDHWSQFFCLFVSKPLSGLPINHLMENEA